MRVWPLERRLLGIRLARVTRHSSWMRAGGCGGGKPPSPAFTGQPGNGECGRAHGRYEAALRRFVERLVERSAGSPAPADLHRSRPVDTRQGCRNGLRRQVHAQPSRHAAARVADRLTVEVERQRPRRRSTPAVPRAPAPPLPSLIIAPRVARSRQARNQSVQQSTRPWPPGSACCRPWRPLPTPRGGSPRRSGLRSELGWADPAELSTSGSQVGQAAAFHAPRFQPVPKAADHVGSPCHAACPGAAGRASAALTRARISSRPAMARPNTAPWRIVGRPRPRLSDGGIGGARRRPRARQRPGTFRIRATIGGIACWPRPARHRRPPRNATSISTPRSRIAYGSRSVVAGTR